MAARRRDAGAGGGRAASEDEFAPVEDEEFEFMRREAELRQQFEPVAPWNRKDIPDYGPLDDRHNLLIFLVIGILATIIYETTSYFKLVGRFFAYAAIWFPLWMRLLTRVSPAPTEEELEEKERREFYEELQHIAEEEDEVDS